MRKALAVLVVAAALAVVGASRAVADTVTSTRSAAAFGTVNDSLHWGLLGVNNFFVANGATLSTNNGILTTVNFGTGGTGATFEQCPASACTWGGNFSPGQELLTDINYGTGGASGRVILSFATGISAIGFQLEPNAVNPNGIETFSTTIAVYDGGTLLNQFYFPDGMEQPFGERNTAGFYGVSDLTGADITSIAVWVYNCAPTSCAPGGVQGFAINYARIDDATPEPASMALLGSGLGLLGFLRRKRAPRK